MSHCLNELLEELNKYEGVCKTASWAFQVNRTSDDQATAFGNLYILLQKLGLNRLEIYTIFIWP